MTVSNLDALRLLRCPNCDQVGRLKNIIYGMPGEDYDFARYAVGGCRLNGTGIDPNVFCPKSTGKTLSNCQTQMMIWNEQPMSNVDFQRG